MKNTHLLPPSLPLVSAASLAGQQSWVSVSEPFMRSFLSLLLTPGMWGFHPGNTKMIEGGFNRPQLSVYAMVDNNISFLCRALFCSRVRIFPLKPGCPKTSPRSRGIDFPSLTLGDGRRSTSLGVRKTGLEFQFHLFWLSDLMGHLNGSKKNVGFFVLTGKMECVHTIHTSPGYHEYHIRNIMHVSGSCPWPQINVTVKCPKNTDA